MALILARIALFLMALANIIYAEPLEDNDDAPDINALMNKSTFCPPFQCPSGYTHVSRWPLTVESTGCQSGQASGMDYTHFESCCHTKNVCHQMCGSNKSMCDDQFESCMEKSCKELPALKDDLADMDEEDIQEAREKCKRMIGLVKMLDNMGGCGRYNLYQANSCECVEKEKAKDKMKSVLEGFYGKYKPNAIGKVDALVEKANGNADTFSKIMLTLYLKYSQAVVKKAWENPNPMKREL